MSLNEIINALNVPSPSHFTVPENCSAIKNTDIGHWRRSKGTLNIERESKYIGNTLQ